MKLILYIYCTTDLASIACTYWNLRSTRPDAASCTPQSKTPVRPPPTQHPAPTIRLIHRTQKAPSNCGSSQSTTPAGISAWPCTVSRGHTSTNDSPDRLWFPMRQKTSRLADAPLSARTPTAHTNSPIFRKTPSTATHSKIYHEMAHPSLCPEAFRMAYIQASAGLQGGHQMRAAGTRISRQGR